VSGPVTSVARVEDVQIFLKDPVYSLLCRKKNENVETEFNTFLLAAEGLDAVFKALYQIHCFTVVNG